MAFMRTYTSCFACFQLFCFFTFLMSQMIDTYDVILLYYMIKSELRSTVNASLTMYNLMSLCSQRLTTKET